MAADMFESQCHYIHERLIAGKCPWCGHVIVNSRDLQSGPGFKLSDFDERIPDVGLIPSLHKFLMSDESAVRQWAAILLGQMGSGARETLPTLSRLLYDENQKVRDAAQEAIKRITEGGK
jgi:hypothetical protein